MAHTKDRELEKILKALANRRRIAILRCLTKRKEMTVSMVAEEIKLSFKSTSRHLTLLHAAGVLDKEQRGLEVFYSLSSDAPKIAHTVILGL